MKTLLLIPLAALFAAGSSLSASAEPGWPTPEQIKRVEQKRASFPAASLVSQVDWYEPLEKVQGVTQPRALPVKAPSRRTIAPAALEKAVAYAEAQKSFALLVWRDGALELEKYWNGFDRKSRFETASMAKTVVALAMGAAVADGRIGSIDDPLERYVPDLKGTRRGALPLRAYTEMRSGIETPPSDGGAETAYWQYAFGDDLKGTVAHWPDTCIALTEFCYANANTMMLGWAIEGATGMRYADWLSRSIWKPIGAGDARLWLDRKGGSPRFSCCLIATAQDWARIGMLLLDNGRVNGKPIVPADWTARMEAPSAANANYGWQIWRGSPHNPRRSYGKRLRAVVPAAQPFARDDVVYLDGSAGQRVYVVRSERLVIVRIGTPSFDWDDSKLPNLILAGL